MRDLGLDLGIYVSETSFFLVFILDAIFCGTIFFFIFQGTVWLVKSS